ncbi:protein Turandot A1/2-like [Drosophila ficusphila]|uniref:protein Turandot A1/2-like n=1 Tax=Drosophila ficusphila TaxID=30025 RepID=UPI0007E80D9E|nr:protein Turandot A1/2-like [Drosophila ficusphila]
MKTSIFLSCFALLLISDLCLGYPIEEREADRPKVEEKIQSTQDNGRKILTTLEEQVDALSSFLSSNNRDQGLICLRNTLAKQEVQFLPKCFNL